MSADLEQVREAYQTFNQVMVQAREELGSNRTFGEGTPGKLTEPLDAAVRERFYTYLPTLAPHLPEAILVDIRGAANATSYPQYYYFLPRRDEIYRYQAHQNVYEHENDGDSHRNFDPLGRNRLGQTTFVGYNTANRFGGRFGQFTKPKGPFALTADRIGIITQVARTALDPAKQSDLDKFQADVSSAQETYGEAVEEAELRNAFSLKEKISLLQNCLLDIQKSLPKRTRPQFPFQIMAGKVFYYDLTTPISVYEHLKVYFPRKKYLGIGFYPGNFRETSKAEPKDWLKSAGAIADGLLIAVPGELRSFIQS